MTRMTHVYKDPYYCKNSECLKEFAEKPKQCNSCEGEVFLVLPDMYDWIYISRYTLPLKKMKKAMDDLGSEGSQQRDAIIDSLESIEEESHYESDNCWDIEEDYHEEMRPKSKMVVRNEAGEPIGWELV